MTRVLILFYLSQGHIEKLAEAVAEGARATGAKFDVKRVPETVPGRGRQKRALQARSSAPPRDCDRARALRRNYRWHGHAMVSCPRRWPFLDRTGALWMRGAFNGKILGAFTSTATQHGPGDDPVFNHLQLAALWHDHRRASLQSGRSNECRRDRGRRALWRNDGGGR